MKCVALLDPIARGSVRNFSTFFQKPKSPAHRQYEALRMFYVDREPAKAVAARFGYTFFAFNALRRDFAREHKASKFFRQVVRRPWAPPLAWLPFPSLVKVRRRVPHRTLPRGR